MIGFDRDAMKTRIIKTACRFILRGFGSTFTKELPMFSSRRGKTMDLNDNRANGIHTVVGKRKVCLLLIC